MKWNSRVRRFLAAAGMAVILVTPPALGVDMTALRDAYTKQYAEVQNSSLPPMEKSAKLGELTRSYKTASGVELSKIGDQIETLNVRDAELDQCRQLRDEEIMKKYADDPVKMQEEIHRNTENYTRSSQELAKAREGLIDHLVGEAEFRLTQDSMRGTHVGKPGTPAITDTTGPIKSSLGRGMTSDAELQTDISGQRVLDEVFNRAGLKGKVVSAPPGIEPSGAIGAADTIVEPGATTYEKTQITVHNEVDQGPKGSSSRAIESQVGTKSRETSVSPKIEKGTPGREHVEMLDEAKKAKPSFDMPPDELYTDPIHLQKAGKGTAKVIGRAFTDPGTQTLTPAGKQTIQDILTKNGLDSSFTPETFAKSMTDLKGNHCKSPRGAGVTPQNIEKVQKAMSDVVNAGTETANAKATVAIEQAEADIQARLKSSDPTVRAKAAAESAEIGLVKDSIKGFKEQKVGSFPEATETSAGGAAAGAGANAVIGPAGQRYIKALNNTTKWGGTAGMGAGAVIIVYDLAHSENMEDFSYRGMKNLGGFTGGLAGGTAAGAAGSCIGAWIGGIVGGAAGACFGGVGAGPGAVFGAEAGSAIGGLFGSIWGGVKGAEAGTEMFDTKSRFWQTETDDEKNRMQLFLNTAVRGKSVLRPDLTVEEAVEMIKKGAPVRDVFITNEEYDDMIRLVVAAEDLDRRRFGKALPGMIDGAVNQAGDWLSGLGGKAPDQEAKLRRVEGDNSGDLIGLGSTALEGTRQLMGGWLDAYWNDSAARDKAAVAFADKSGAAMVTERKAATDAWYQWALDGVERQNLTMTATLGNLQRSMDSMLAEQKWQRENSWGAWLQSVMLGSAESAAQGFGTGFGTQWGKEWTEKILDKHHHKMPPPPGGQPLHPDGGSDGDDHHAEKPPEPPAGGTAVTAKPGGGTTTATPTPSTGSFYGNPKPIDKVKDATGCIRDPYPGEVTVRGPDGYLQPAGGNNWQ